jgi:hypothetical protein
MDSVSPTQARLRNAHVRGCAALAWARHGGLCFYRLSSRHCSGGTDPDRADVVTLHRIVLLDANTLRCRSSYTA